MDFLKLQFVAKKTKKNEGFFELKGPFGDITKFSNHSWSQKNLCK